ncbi:MAG: glycosyltransferase family 1 protein [candidate division WOR-3 bacterium]
MKLGILALFFDDAPRGIGKSTGFLIREFSHLEGDYEILSPLIPNGANSEKFKRVSLALAPARGRWGNVKRFFWQNFLLKFRNYRNVLSTSYESSLLYFGNQAFIIHDVINLKFRDFRYPPLIKYYYNFQAPLVIKFGAKIVVPSNVVKGEILEIYNVKEEDVGVVYWGIDRDMYRFVEDKEVLKKYSLEPYGYILYVGDVIHRKNIQLIIKALQFVKDKVLVIVGTQFKKVKNELEGLANSLNVYQRVKFLGYVPDKELIALYSQAFAFVYPSFIEGFGMPPLEAASCGTPVIVSDIPVFRELYSGYFLFVDPHNPEDLAEKLKGLEDEDIRKNIKKGYEELLKKYTWKNSAKTLHNILQNWGLL